MVDNLNTAKQNAPATQAFYEQVAQALKNYSDPEWLGQHSLLARPYFLGSLAQAAPTAFARGQALQQCLQHLVETWPQRHADPYYGELLRWAFLQDPIAALRRQPLYAQAPLKFEEAILVQLAVSRAKFYKDRPKAIEQLAQDLLADLQPALRAGPPVTATALFGCGALLAHAQAILQAGHSLALTGPGGVGKTALGVALATAWPAVFWFTIQPGLNDHLLGLLFALGRFLHAHGATQLWQLVWYGAEARQTLHLAAVLEAVRADVGHLPHRPLWVFDELDLLRPAELEAHAQMVAVLEVLRPLAPGVWLGQQALLDTDQHLALSGLPLPALADWMTTAGLALPTDDLAQLHTYTRGQPRLVELCVALLRLAVPLAEVLAQAGGAPSVEFLTRRVWRRLPPPEQDVLLELAVFRRPAPAEAWADQQGAVAQLQARQLVHTDGVGGLALLPAVRDALYTVLLAPEDKARLHRRAAELRAERGEVLAAAHHYVQAHELALAVWLGYTHLKSLIQMGQGPVALALFGQLDPAQLPHPQDQRALALLMGELWLLQGHFDLALARLRTTDWAPLRVSAARAHELWGDLLQARGQTEPALEHYRAAFDVYAGLLERQLVNQWANRSDIFLDQAETATALREAQQALWQAHHALGAVYERQGHYAQAEAEYQAALLQAQAAGHEPGTIKTTFQLGNLLAYREQYAAALAHWTTARRYYEKIGAQAHAERLRANMVFLHTRLGDYAAALAAGQAALSFFQAAHSPQWVAICAANLAEAHLGLAQWAAAEHYANQCLTTEDPFTRPWGLFALSQVRLAQGQLTEAATFSEQALASAVAAQDRFAQAVAARSWGQVLHAQGQISAAREKLAQALATFNQLQMLREVERTTQLLHQWG